MKQYRFTKATLRRILSTASYGQNPPILPIQPEEIPEPEAALPGASVKGVLVFTLKPDSKAVYQKITVRVIEKEEETVIIQTELSYSEAERLRRMEKEDYSIAEERWFLLSNADLLYDPAFMEILLKENLK